MCESAEWGDKENNGMDGDGGGGGGGGGGVGGWGGAIVRGLRVALSSSLHPQILNGKKTPCRQVLQGRMEQNTGDWNHYNCIQYAVKYTDKIIIQSLKRASTRTYP
jgi:hypothetical protein